jgi:hypothetical protein
VNWRVFLPGFVILVVAWGPLLFADVLVRPFGAGLMGFGMAWGFIVTLPLTLVGGLTLIGGVFALVRSIKKSE